MRYVVVRTGVYDQGVIDTTILISLAKVRAEDAAEKEEDLYHDFEIRSWSEHDKEFSTARWVFKTEDDVSPREWMKVA